MGVLAEPTVRVPDPRSDLRTALRNCHRAEIPLSDVLEIFSAENVDVISAL